ncbi:TetR/AcrR family transcriptional regulator [Delftia sp. CH05]|uniref:TetR/AcrR family transcriptional regulator n=1 Tax=Delftia sp. CH05 TaxID=2692194 RepID=UPI00135F011B|nr:TetR/AcrR family transcriptional regulator [Delftia sp. CH05]MXN30187.1 TetR family transcriptional regulator [Delftia sp. CH05]
MPSSRRPSSRKKLLTAAANLIAEDGVMNLTIERTAANAGVTKAGLVYHFKTRDELLSALVENMVEELDSQTHGSEQVKRESTPKSLLSSMENLTFNMPPEQKRFLANMLAVASTHEHLMPPVRTLFAKGYNGLDCGGNPGLTLILAAALDGILLLELLKLHIFTPEQVALMHKTIRELSAELD